MTQVIPPMDMPPPVSEWQVLGYRLTLFFVNAVGRNVGERWWEQATGGPAPNRVTDQKLDVVQERGTVDDLHVMLVRAPQRIDIIVGGKQEVSENAELPFSPAPALPDGKERFLAIANKWLGFLPPVTRIAVGCTLSKVRSDRESALRLLSAYVPTVRPTADLREFQLQVNRQRPATNGVMVNHFSTWSIAAFTKMSVTAENSQQPIVSATEHTFAAHADIDINTVPMKSMSSANLTDLIRDLAQAMQEVAETGDSR